MALLTFISALLLIAFGLLIYLGFRRKAINNPKSFLKKATDVPGKRLVLFGDSQTHSTLSSDYASMLRSVLNKTPVHVINAGKNGDTALGLLHRLKRDVLPCRPDLLIIYAGTNDVLQKTTLKNYSSYLSEIIQQVKALKDIPIALVSFPPLGENLRSRRNAEVDRFNQVLSELAAAFKISYLPFNETLKAYLSDKPQSDDSEFSMRISRLLMAAFKKYYLGQSYNKISGANRLHILTDGIHLNDISGGILATMLQQWIMKQPAHTGLSHQVDLSD